MVSDGEISLQNHDFNKDSLYGLLVLPVIGIALSTLAIILRRYQVKHDWRCFNWLHRCRQGQMNHQNTNADSHHYHRHPNFWNNLFEYDSSFTNSSQDILFMDTAVQTTFPDVSIAQEEIFEEFESDASNLSPLDEDEVIYANIKERELNVDIVDPIENLEDDNQISSSITRSGKVYK